MCAVLLPLGDNTITVNKYIKDKKKCACPYLFVEEFTVEVSRGLLNHIIM
jgi:hypothetical protein